MVEPFGVRPMTPEMLQAIRERQAAPPPETEPVSEEQRDVIERMLEPPAQEAPKDDLAELFEVPQQDDNDMAVDDLFELDEEEELGDLVDVSREDIMGSEPKSSPQHRITPKGKRVVRREPPSTSLGGMR